MRLVRFCLLFCLLSILPAYASVPSAVRTLQSGEVDFESVIRVDVAVSFDDGDLPTAWILEERWSDDCRVLRALPAPRRLQLDLRLPRRGKPGGVRYACLLPEVPEDD